MWFPAGLCFSLLKDVHASITASCVWHTNSSKTKQQVFVCSKIVEAVPYWWLYFRKLSIAGKKVKKGTVQMAWMFSSYQHSPWPCILCGSVFTKNVLVRCSWTFPQSHWQSEYLILMQSEWIMVVLLVWLVLISNFRVESCSIVCQILLSFRPYKLSYLQVQHMVDIIVHVIMWLFPISVTNLGM